MTTLNFLKQTKNYLRVTLLFATLMVNAQEMPVATDNIEIAGVTVESFYLEEGATQPDKNTFAIHLLDNDPDTNWAATTADFTTDETFIVIDLEKAVTLTEVQLLTLSKDDPYAYDIFVSTTGLDAGDFTDAFTASEKGVSGYLESNLDATYNSFVLPTEVEGARYVKIFCYGRPALNANGSVFTTISELKFYSSDATASTRDNTLSQALVYPNPVKDVLNVTNLNGKVNKVDVVSLEGKVVISKEVKNSSEDLSLDTSKLVSGMYFLNFSNTAAKSNASRTIIVGGN